MPLGKAARHGREAYEEGNELPPEAQARSVRWKRCPRSRSTPSDAPEILDWSDARHGVFYRPVKQQITLRIDADFIA